MSGKADRIISALSVAATLLIGWVSLNATVDIASWGGVPPKNLEASYIGPTDPLSDLSSGSGVVKVSVESGSRQLHHVRIVQATLRNTGRAPILPAEMAEPLSIKAAAPWRIIGVANQDLLAGSAPQLKWRKVSDQEFISEPTLINPGDLVWAIVYLTWEGTAPTPDAKMQPVSWRTRIANLRGISVEEDLFERFARVSGPVQVNIWGWGVPFVLLSFALYSCLTILLLTRAGLLKLSATHTLLRIPAASLVNLSAADAGTTYVFGANQMVVLPASHWVNLPPLIINAAMLCWLYWRSRTHGRP